MWRNRFARAVMAATVAVCSTKAQGFVNLDFESARVSTPPNPYVPFAEAFPGWSGTIGGSPPIALYNNYTLGTACFTLIGASAGSTLEGQYTAVFQIGARIGGGYAAPSLFQTAVIPLAAQSIRLKAAEQLPSFSVSDEFAVSIGGQQITMQPIGGNSDYTLFAGDVARFAGMTAELKVSGVVSLDRPLRNVAIDSIEFSTEPVPEPSTYLLFAAGVTILGFVRRARCPNQKSSIFNQFCSASEVLPRDAKI